MLNPLCSHWTALISHFHNSPRSPWIHIQILQSNLKGSSNWVLTFTTWHNGILFDLTHIFTGLLVILGLRWCVSFFLLSHCQPSITREQPFALQITAELTSQVSCHLTCHVTVWGLRGVKGYKISSLNKLPAGKGHKHFGATKSNYRTGLAMEYKTTCTCSQTTFLGKNRTTAVCTVTEILRKFFTELPFTYFYIWLHLHHEDSCLLSCCIAAFSRNTETNNLYQSGCPATCVQKHQWSTLFMRKTLESG